MKVVLFILFFFISLITAAQDFTVSKPDITAFPDVSFIVTGKKDIDKGKVSITDNKKAVKDYKWVPVVGENISEPAAVFFLIEASSFVSDNQMAFIKKAVKMQLLSLNKKVLANAGFYVRSNSVEMLKRLSTEFTADFNSLSRDVESKVYAAKDKIPVTDLYKVVYECIDFIGKKSDLPVNKKIILISTGNNNGTSAFTINECVTKAKENNITVTTIGLKSTTQNAVDNLKLIAEKTNGSFTFAKNEDDINLFLQHESGSDNNVSYKVQYVSNAASANDTVDLQINIGGQVQKAYYISEKKDVSGFFDNNKMVFLISGGLLILIIAGLIFYLKKKRKKEAEDFGVKQQQLSDRELLRKKAENEALENKNTLSSAQSLVLTDAAINKPVPEENINRTRIAGVRKLQITVLQPGANRLYELNNLSTHIGRNADNEIIIADKTVSGVHAIISIEQGKIFITDKDSTNGTFVNNNKVQRSELQNNDLITLGKIDIRYNY